MQKRNQAHPGSTWYAMRSFVLKRLKQLVLDRALYDLVVMLFAPMTGIWNMIGKV
jgi:hypothetical protein